MKKLLTLLSVACAAFVNNPIAFAADYEWIGAGTWAAATFWSPTAPAGGPTALDNITGASSAGVAIGEMSLLGARALDTFTYSGSKTWSIQSNAVNSTLTADSLVKSGSSLLQFRSNPSPFTLGLSFDTVSMGGGFLSFGVNNVVAQKIFGLNVSTSTTVSAGTVSIANDAASTYNLGQLIVNSGGTANLNDTNYVNNITANATGLSGTGGIIQAGASNVASTLTLVTNSSGNFTSASVIQNGAASQVVALTKEGLGTQTLTGNSTYRGATTVSAGTLLINGNNSGATGAVSVAAAGTLGGNGTVGGATTILGTHSPGNSPGIQTFSSNLTYSGGNSTVLWELEGNSVAGRGTNYDGINVSGNLAFSDATALSLTFNGTMSGVDWNDGFWALDRTGTSGWLVYDVAGSTSGFSNLTIAPSSWLDSNSASLGSIRSLASFSLYQDGNDVYLNYTAIPEPGSAALVGVAGLLCWICRRSRCVG